MTLSQQAQTSDTPQSLYDNITKFVKKNNVYTRQHQEAYKDYTDATDRWHSTHNLEVRARASAQASAFNLEVAELAVKMVPVPADPKEWTRDDLKLLAQTIAGRPAFESIAGLYNMAVGQDPSVRIEAQKKLLELKPDSQTLKEFVKTIYDVGVEAAQESQKAKTPVKKPIEAGVGKVGAVFDADHGIKLSNPADEKLDAQALLAVLDEKGVKVSADQSLKTPTFDEAALAAVKNIKQSVSLAA